MPHENPKTDSIDELWIRLTGDYLQKKGDPLICKGGRQIITDIVEMNVPPARVRAAWNYFLDDLGQGEKHGFRMERFEKQVNFYLDMVRAGDGSRPKEKRSHEGDANATYLCSNWRCKRPQELILDRLQCDGDFPEGLEDSCRGCQGRMLRLDIHPNATAVRLGISPEAFQDAVDKIAGGG